MKAQTKKNRKTPVNLTLGHKEKRFLKQMQKEDERPSRVSMVEHLILEEAKRRGLLALNGKKVTT